MKSGAPARSSARNHPVACPNGGVTAAHATRDHADTAPFFGGTTPVSGDGLYEYDALYRLTSATGREHPGTQPVDTDPPPGTAIPHRNDLQALQAYIERYQYDDAGNIEQGSR